MTENDHNQDHDQEGSPPIQASHPVSNREASVRLRGDESGQETLDHMQMDTANESLAEALKITYGLLKVAMGALVVLFVVSGVQSIKEGERGIRVQFGEQVRANLEPGLRWSLPYPFGEIVRVGEGATEIAVAKEFMPNIAGTQTDQEALEANIDRFNDLSTLKPAKDGSNITGDLNIAHTQWSVNYRRTNHALYVTNIIATTEAQMMKVVVQRAVVQVMATVNIDDLLKNSSESLEGRIRTLAQQTLDDLQAGITIDRIVLTRKNAALSLRDKFNSVQTAAQTAGKDREDALMFRDQMLSEVAGRASDLLIEEINEYERLIELGLHQESEAKLARIDAILEGREIEVDGQLVGSLISGEISELLNEAHAISSNRVNQAIAQLEHFRSKEAQFEANPQLMIARDWSSAMAEFLDKEFVSTIMLPVGVSAEMLINNDPDIAREIDRERKRREAQESIDLRREEMNRSWQATQRGLKEPEE